ncbi:hypothetical protein K9N50_10380 [bacterium]|nr:hypothetical protein [bacterium]
MGRLIALILIFYIGFTFARFIVKLMGGNFAKTMRKQKDQKSVRPWQDEDVEDADFKDID